MMGGIIEHRQGYLEVDCGRSDPRELAELYRAFAVRCVQQQTRRALVKALGGEPDGHLALRDALTTMVLAGVASQFRLALVTDALRLQALFLELRVDLRRLHISAEVFGDEGRAIDWLRGPPAAAAPAPSLQPQG